jgi:mono/diheme cytochrome c family protein
LSRQNKQYNLECVGCHVTGYEAPGGSTVAHVEKLENVQCEVCHGPGSRHLADPKDKSLITLTPEKSLCASKCHHPPHVNASWSVDESWKIIVGPGHGG